MITVEIYTDEDKLLRRATFPAMIRVGEYISIFEDDYFKYYSVKKIWYRLESGSNDGVPCAEVLLDD